MNPYIYPATCDVCGGEGRARPGEGWGGGRHVDPAVCAAVLARRRWTLEKREAALATASPPQEPDSPA